MKGLWLTPLQWKFKKHVFIKLLDKVHKSYSLNLLNLLKDTVLQHGLLKLEGNYFSESLVSLY